MAKYTNTLMNRAFEIQNSLLYLKYNQILCFKLRVPGHFIRLNTNTYIDPKPDTNTLNLKH